MMHRANSSNEMIVGWADADLLVRRLIRKQIPGMIIFRLLILLNGWNKLLSNDRFLIYYLRASTTCRIIRLIIAVGVNLLLINGIVHGIRDCGLFLYELLIVWIDLEF